MKAARLVLHFDGEVVGGTPKSEGRKIDIP